MGDVLTNLGIEQFLTPERVLGFVRAAVLLIAGFPIARLVRGAVRRGMRKRSSEQEAMLVGRLVYYVLLGLILATALHQLGFQLGVLLGAAGILTVAVGFASQTSASNLISGLFLIAERPFVVGDVITVEGTTGEILSIDLLSIKLRTFDNLFVRVPNEQIIKTRVTNLSRFPIRRADIQVGVAYREDLPRMKEVLSEVARKNVYCLEEPKPLLIFKAFGESALEFQYSVWGERDRFLDLRNSMQEQIKAAFDDHGIEIPFPHRTIYTGSVTSAFPVRMVEPEGSDAAPSGAESEARPRDPDRSE